MGVVENMQHKELLRAVPIVNGGYSEGRSERRSLENGDCSVVTTRYKRRKVSAIRDFPPGCGPLARRMPKEAFVCVGSSEKLDGGGKSEDALEVDGVNVPGTAVESKSPKELANSIQTEMPDTSNELHSEVQKTVMSSDLAHGIELMHNEPEKTESLMSDARVFEPIKSLEQEASQILKDFHQVEEMPPPGSVKVSSPPNGPMNAPSVLEKTVTKKYPPRRKISAIRDFPPFCGRNAPRLSEEECLKAPAPSKGAPAPSKGAPAPSKGAPAPSKGTPAPSEGAPAPSKGKTVGQEESGVKEKPLTEPVSIDGKQMGEDVQDRDVLKEKLRANVSKNSRDKVQDEFKGSANKELKKQVTLVISSEVKMEFEVKREQSIGSPRENNLPRPDQKSQIVEKANEVLEGKVGKEIVIYSKDENIKRKVTSLSGRVNKVPAGDELSQERVTVLCLMAAQNCPWRRQGKGGLKLDSGMSGRKGKKDGLAGLEKSKSIVRARTDRAEKSGGKSIKKKWSPMRKAENLGMGQLVVKDEEDSIEHYEEQGDFHVGQRLLDFNVSLPPFGPSSSSGKVEASDSIVTRNKVRETLRLFQAIFRKLLQEEEAKTKQGGNPVRRVDYLASRILKDKGKHVNTGKQIIGPVPGVEVGDEFQYRVELGIIGLHRPTQGGIDYRKHGGKILATSIVASGGYADDLDNSDVLIYSGQGGNLIGGDKQPEDQKLERGNLALKNSIDAKNLVRVIRGFKETKAPEYMDSRAKVVTTYIYDGLYLVEKYWQEIGPHGKLVFKFQLNRIPGQPELAWKEVKNSKKFKVREGLCVDDISMGKEPIPIFAVNTIDDEKPPPFTYITSMIYPDWCHRLPPNGCDCSNGCSDSEKCSCAVKNGGEIPYNYNGAIVEAKPLVYECGPSCKCSRSCHNRVSQHGIKFQLEIFKTVSRGWGVRSLTSIPSGSFICEYIGELLEDKEAEQRTGNDEYLFDIGHNYNEILWDGISTLMPDAQSSSCEVVEDAGFTIDAAQYGNVGRFINHSCSPNLYAQNVLYDHDNKRIPHIMLFAAENIPPLQELTYHYNYTIDQVRDSNGNIKKKSCYCGSDECTGRMY